VPNVEEILSNISVKDDGNVISRKKRTKLSKIKYNITFSYRTIKFFMPYFEKQ
jgi:hypothetical protein